MIKSTQSNHRDFQLENQEGWPVSARSSRTFACIRTLRGGAWFGLASGRQTSLHTGLSWRHRPRRCGGLRPRCRLLPLRCRQRNEQYVGVRVWSAPVSGGLFRRWLGQGPGLVWRGAMSPAWCWPRPGLVWSGTVFLIRRALTCLGWSIRAHGPRTTPPFSLFFIGRRFWAASIFLHLITIIVVRRFWAASIFLHHIMITIRRRFWAASSLLWSTIIR